MFVGRKCQKKGAFSHVTARTDITYQPRKHLIESAHDKTYNKTCATIGDSDKIAHLRSLIRVFADRMCLLQQSGINENPWRTGWMYRLI